MQGDSGSPAGVAFTTPRRRTATPYRGHGIGSEIVRRLLATVEGQHVGLFTSDRQAFYRRLGFEVEPDGMSLVAGSWLNRP
jgi:GNAT superfamily N-acetyltransferase